ncbi:exo-beta-N-acetylmuramidase NamZ family protein [Pseudofulvibacter geojedonensis]|uniref:Exo-beta-N-acetylmuramidase NamZ domain-containing protein n=1 Tax=Pseudofulvibacter geojedonensis TaxID=1123758 RepID=A0ABW3I0R1_9FLAO
MRQSLLVFTKNTFLILVGFLFLANSCQSQKKEEIKPIKHDKTELEESTRKALDIITGANQTENYLPLIKNKTVGVVANQTSVIFTTNNYTHLVDSLLTLNINIKKVFAPEHGFRGKADAGETIKDGKDAKTGIDIISIYGKNKKPSKQQLEGLDIMIFDIQDVGARFYTYISSLHYIMEACAENNIPVLIFDRPNPNGHYIDGPILELENKSFVGMHPIPVVHGMTIGEYAKMINGEKWLKNGMQCNITVIPCANYTKKSVYSLPIKPSPNLPNDTAINLYPSLCFFEGTNISVGRGTNKQFQVYGAPHLPKSNFSFTPHPNEGAKYPKHQNTICYGKDLSNKTKLDHLNLEWIIDAYKKTPNKDNFFNSFFIKLAGTKKLQKQIENGASLQEIKASWKSGLNNYNLMREKYLIY